MFYIKHASMQKMHKALKEKRVAVINRVLACLLAACLVGGFVACKADSDISGKEPDITGKEYEEIDNVPSSSESNETDETDEDANFGIESQQERYYLYFKGHSRHVNPLFSFPDPDKDRLDSNLMIFAISNSDNYSYEKGIAKSEIDALLIKYFGRTVTSYDSATSRVMPSGNVQATGWSYHGANRLVLTKLVNEPDGSYTGYFDVYSLPELHEDLDDLGGYEAVDSALQRGETAGLERLYSDSVIINFNEISDDTEPQGFYIRFNSIEFVKNIPSPSSNRPDPVYDPASYLSDEEMVTADGVGLAMTYEEVLAIIGEPDEVFDNSEGVKSLTKNGYHYGFYQINESFGEGFPLPDDGKYYLLHISAFEGCTDPLPRGIRIGDDIQQVFDKFPTRDRALRKWAIQTVYGEQEVGKPRAFLEYTTVLGRYRLYATTTTQALNITFDKENKVESIELVFEKG